MFLLLLLLLLLLLFLHFSDTHDFYPHPRPTTSTHDPRQLVILVCDENLILPNGRTKHCEHVSMSLRASEN